MPVRHLDLFEVWLLRRDLNALQLSRRWLVVDELHDLLVLLDQAVPCKREVSGIDVDHERRVLDLRHTAEDDGPTDARGESLVDHTSYTLVARMHDEVAHLQHPKTVIEEFTRVLLADDERLETEVVGTEDFCRVRPRRTQLEIVLRHIEFWDAVDSLRIAFAGAVEVFSCLFCPCDIDWEPDEERLGQRLRQHDGTAVILSWPALEDGELLAQELVEGPG